MQETQNENKIAKFLVKISKFVEISYLNVGLPQTPYFDSSLHPELHPGDVDELHDGGRSQVSIEHCRHDLWFLAAPGGACAVLEL